MKILYFFDEDDKYGAPKTGMEMIKYLKENFNIIPVVLTSRLNNVNKFCDDNGIENYVTGHRKYTYVMTNNIVKSLLKLFPRYFRYIFGNFIAQYKIKKYVNLDEIDLIHSNISSLEIGAIIGKKYNIRNIMHIREFGDLDFNMHSYRKNYIKFLNENVDYFIAISEAIRTHWINKGIEVNKIVTIYNGLNLDGIDKKEEYNLTGNLKMLMLGSINEGKGQKELVDAISKVNNEIREKLEVDIIGSGFKEIEKELKDKIKMSSLQNIINFKTYDNDIRKKIKNYDIGIICSKAEGFGRVTVEYMKAGLCIIASNTGANVELIKDNYNGLLYKKGDSQELANLIEKLYYNRKIIKQFADKAYKKATQQFTVNIFAKNVCDFYTYVLNNERKR